MTKQPIAILAVATAAVASVAAAGSVAAAAPAAAGAPAGSVALAAGAPASAAAVTREFEGTIVSVNRDARTFRIRDAERGTRRIRVTSSTRYERIAGFSGLRKGLRDVEVTARRSGKRWVAVDVERSGGGGSHQGGGRDHDEDD